MTLPKHTVPLSALKLPKGNSYMTTQTTDAAVQAIKFAVNADSGMEFLRAWLYGEFDICRNEWPQAPEACYIGADPLVASTIKDVPPELVAITQLLERPNLQAGTLDEITERLKKLIEQSFPNVEQAQEAISLATNRVIAQDTLRILRESRDMARQHRKELEQIARLKAEQSGVANA